MTDITKLFLRNPLPWRVKTLFDGDLVIVDAKDANVIASQPPDRHYLCNWVAGLANALHAERQNRDPVIRTADELDQIDQMKRNIVSNANRIGRAFELIGDLERIVRDGERLEAIEKRLDAIAKHAMKVSGMIGMGVVPESKSTWLGLASAIASAARGSDE